MSYNPAARRLTAEDCAEMRRRWLAGETQRDLAREYGVNPVTVQTAINRPYRFGTRQHEAYWRGKRLTDEQRERATQMRAEGKTCAAIAKVIGCHETTVQAIVRHLPRPERKPKTHCLRGHARTPENLTANGACRVCARAWRAGDAPLMNTNTIGEMK